MSDSYTGGRGNTAPGYRKDLGEIQREIRKIWKRIGKQGNQRTIDIKEVVWGYSAVVKPAADVLGQRWPAIGPIIVSSVELTLVGASTSPIIVQSYVGPELFDTITLQAGDLYERSSMFKKMVPGEFLRPVIKATSTGTGVALGIVYRYSVVGFTSGTEVPA